MTKVPTQERNTISVFSHEVDNESPDLKHLNTSEQRKLHDIRRCYQERVQMQPVNKSQIPYEQEINLKDETPVISKPRILPQAYEKDIYKQINDLFGKGVVEISDSPYASPIVPVVKRDGSIRLCCDYRKLNEKTVLSTFPIPRNENLFDLKKAEVYTVLDLKSAYWHIALKKDDQYKTAFVVPNGKYQWTVLPYGLSDAAFSLAYVMNEVLREFDFAKSFFDDCIIYANRVDHLDHIGRVLKKFAKLDIHINMAKCQFMRRVIFVGHTVNNTGIRPGESKSQELMDFKNPKTRRNYGRS